MIAAVIETLDVEIRKTRPGLDSNFRRHWYSRISASRSIQPSPAVLILKDWHSKDWRGEKSANPVSPAPTLFNPENSVRVTGSQVL